MKPQIEQVIYSIWQYYIIKQQVGYLGKESFIITDYDDNYIHDKEFRYDEFNKKWFLTLDDAKKLLSNDLEEDEEIVQLNDNYWEIQEKYELEPIDIDL